MPLRDHFRPPVSRQASWEGFHGLWPGMIVIHLSRILPADFTAEPRVHLGTNFEIDVCAYEPERALAPRTDNSDSSGAVATATYAPPEPTMVAELELTEEYAYEVLIYDHSRGRQLVAAVEIVSPGNKDRPESRRAFVAKCSALLQERVCVSLIDLVTTRHFNLYGELMELAGQPDPQFSPTAPATYAVTCRGRKVRERPRFEVWAYPLVVGQVLPTLPLWLAEDLAVSLDLETSYQEACRVLRIA